jgi:type VI protein secretion system component VasK
MASTRRPAPPPLEANDRRVTIVGTVAWAIALAVLLVLRGQIPASDRWWIWTCAVGVAMGLFALWYVPRFKRARARKAQRRAEARAAAAAQPEPGSSDSKTVSSTETPGTSTRS